MPRGIKTCGKCGAGCGPRSHECNSCGASFTGREIPVKRESSGSVEQTPSRGRKQCKQCQKFVGVRTQICECGFDFATNVKQVVSPVTVEVKRLNLPSLPDADKFPRVQYTVYAPSGKPICLPKSNTEEDINEWGCKVVEWGRQNGKLYTNEALLYWLHTYKFDRNLLTRYPYDKEIAVEPSGDRID